MAKDLTIPEQASLLDTLADEKRLRILRHAVEGPVAAPRLAEMDEFTISAESLLYHMNKLESVGFLESKTVQGQYKRPVKEFQIAGEGKQLILEVVAGGEMKFDLRDVSEIEPKFS